MSENEKTPNYDAFVNEITKLFHMEIVNQTPQLCDQIDAIKKAIPEKASFKPEFATALAKLFLEKEQTNINDPMPSDLSRAIDWVWGQFSEGDFPATAVKDVPVGNVWVVREPAWPKGKIVSVHRSMVGAMQKANALNIPETYEGRVSEIKVFA